MILYAFPSPHHRDPSCDLCTAFPAKHLSVKTDHSLPLSTATIAANKEGVKFSVSGDMGTGNVTVRQNATAEKEQQTLIELQEPVSLTFALRYLNFFTKATPMSEQVTLSLSKEVPLAVEYQVGEMGHLRYYLAPKVDEDE